MVPASILYKDRRLDFDPTLTVGLDLICAGGWSLVRTLVTSNIEAMEINEPLLRTALPRAALAVGVLRIAGVLRRRRVAIVCYAIENRDAFEHNVAIGLKARLRTRVEWFVAKRIASQIDRIAYGTNDAKLLYEKVLGRQLRSARSAIFLAVPTACRCAISPPAVNAELVVFIGALVARKGLPALIQAWPHVKSRRSPAKLTIVGEGALQIPVQQLASSDPMVTFLKNPPRGEIHDVLHRASCLVLLSQPSPIWREQVGLPIIEGLAHGCSIITTTETGLADWLATNGHIVVAPDAPPDVIGARIAESLESARPRASVLADLPAIDGRLAADAWLFQPQVTPSAIPPAIEESCCGACG